jgi:hypothetical protein
MYNPECVEQISNQKRLYNTPSGALSVVILALLLEWSISSRFTLPMKHSYRGNETEVCMQMIRRPERGSHKNAAVHSTTHAANARQNNTCSM